MYEFTTYRGPRPWSESNDGSFPTLVLAEKDNDMWLTVIRFGEPPKPGATFVFLEQEWEIIWREAVGCGAVPK